MRHGTVVTRWTAIAAALAVTLLLICAPAGAATQRSFVGATSDEIFEQLGAGLPSNPDDLVSLGVGTVRQTFDWNFLTYGMPAGQLNFVWLDRYMRGISPTQAIVRPASGPRCSSKVIRSAISWHG